MKLPLQGLGGLLRVNLEVEQNTLVTRIEPSTLELTRTEQNILVSRAEQSPPVTRPQLRFTTSILDSEVPLERRNPLIPTTASAITGCISSPMRTTFMPSIPHAMNLTNYTHIMSSSVYSNPLAGPSQSVIVRNIIEEHNKLSQLL